MISQGFIGDSRWRAKPRPPRGSFGSACCARTIRCRPHGHGCSTCYGESAEVAEHRAAWLRQIGACGRQPPRVSPPERIDGKREPMWWMTLSTGSEVDERAETFSSPCFRNWPRRLNWYAGCSRRPRGVSARWADGCRLSQSYLIRKEVRFVDSRKARVGVECATE